MFQLDLLEAKNEEREPAKVSDGVLETDNQEIAIVGISAKLPKSETHEQFWKVLQDGMDCVDVFPEARKRELEPYLRRIKSMYESISIFDGAYLEDISSFDYSFFRLSPKEASLMSPNQRLFLQSAWHALEDGGYGGDALHGSRTGVFIGHNADVIHDYKRMIETVNPEALALAAPGNLSSMIASRISYLLNLRGPAISVDTACSSSLVAVHLACQSIRSGECDTAIAGSVKLNLLPLDIGIRLGIESSDNRAKPFDDSSDGTGIGDGVVALLLKPLAKAMQDRDHVYAVIKGSAMNQDGSSIGITAPNALAQEDVIIRAWQDAGINPESITYMEAHGTGTSLGDPIEIDGITRAFSRYTDKKQFCAIGSVKSNIGHLDHAAGIVGLLKGVLSLVNKQLPPTLHYHNPNRKISFIDSPVYVNNTLAPWSDESGKRRCGVSAFGMSGTNCHVILEEAPEVEVVGEVEDEVEASRKVAVFSLSAQTKSALQRAIVAYQKWMVEHADNRWDLRDLCFTASTGRGHYSYRMAAVVTTRNELQQLINSLHVDQLSESTDPNLFFGENVGVALDKEMDRQVLESFARTTKNGEGQYDAAIQLAIQYTSGAKVDWKQLFHEEKRRRISLPVYMFDQHPCWVDESAPKHQTPLSSIEEMLQHGSIDDELREEMLATIEGWRRKLQLSPQSSSLGNTVLLLDGCTSVVEQSVANAWGDLLGYKELHSSSNYYELGGDSILALRIVNRLSDSWEVRLEVMDLLGQSTLRSFAKLLENRCKEGLDQEQTQRVSITAIAVQEHYAISSPQRRMYLQQQAFPEDRSYNLPELLHIEGEISGDRLEEVIRALVERHEMLRTSFTVVEGEIRQFIRDEVNFKLTRLNVSEDEVDETLQRLYIPFDLQVAPLLRAALLTINETKHVLFLDMHHIVSDGFSAGILLSELITLYRGVTLEPLKLNYRDFAAWQAEQLQTERMEKQKQYWHDKCRGEWPVLELPTDFPRPPIKSNHGETFDLYIDAELSEHIRNLAKGNEATLFMVLLAAYYTLLAKYTGGEDIAVGTPIAGRVSHEVESIVGMFVGTLVLRGYPEANKPFLQFLEEVKETSVKAYENAEYPFEELALHMDRRDISRNPLFDTMFIMQNLHIPNFSGETLTYKHERFVHGTAKYDLMIQAVEQSDGEIRLVVEYCTDLFRSETVQKIMQHYVSLLRNVVGNPEQTLGECEMYSPEDYKLLLHDFGSRPASFPQPKSIHTCFEEQAQRVPDAIAVSCRGQELTYRELNEKVNVLARKLQQNGVVHHSIIGVMAERSIPMLTGMLAIMKAGGAYMPIDPNYPLERITYMLTNSGTTLLLTDQIHTDLETALPINQLLLTSEEKSQMDSDVSNLVSVSSVDDLMYVIYTSGSTGEPKGVMVPHRSFFNFGYSLREFYGGEFDERDRCLSLTNISFDVSVSELFMPLMFGASVVLYPEPQLLDARQLASVIVEEGVTSAYLPPMLLKEVAEALRKSTGQLRLNKMLVGVEPIRDETLEMFVHLNPMIKIINGYGPTEATVCSNMYVYQPGKTRGVNVPIGGPMHGVDIHILGYGDKPAPLGAPGELCIAGNGLALGYVNKPELTASKFVAHPLQPGRMMYRTGDLAKWLPDGNAMYLGRMDHQVKIRGIRIELGEIGTQLQKHEAIDAVVVIAHENEDGDKRICAYIVTNRATQRHELKSFLKSKLPDYMIPSFFIPIEEIPLTPNGKVDRKALPEPLEGMQVNIDAIAPRTELELKVAEVMQSVLGINQIGVFDDFFELGGHSLKAAVFAGRIEEKFGIAMPLKTVFDCPTVAQLAQKISNEGKGIQSEGDQLSSQRGYHPIERQEEREHYPMSRAQRRQYVLQMLSEEATMYHVPFALQITGELDAIRLEKAFHKLIDRHESLRTTFHYKNEGFQQIIHEHGQFDLERCSLDQATSAKWVTSSNAGTVHGLVEVLMSRFIRPFELGSLPLLRAGLMELEEGRQLLLLDMHHIVTDGVSMGLLVRELIELYSGAELPELRVQFKDYAVWQENRLSGQSLAAHGSYWMDLYEGELPVLELPIDKPRPLVQNYEGKRFTFTVDKELKERAHRLAKEQGTTLYSVLLGAYAVMLSKYSGQEDVIIGTPVAGRTHADLEGLIGMFVNTVSIRSRPLKTLAIGQYVKGLHDDVLRALEHQEYPLEELVEQLGLTQDQSRNPLFDTMFILQNMERAALVAGELTFEPQRFDAGVSKFDLTLEAVENEWGISFSLEYATSLFHEETIERMAQHYCAIVMEMTADQGAERSIGGIELLDETERQLLLSVSASTGEPQPQWKSIVEEIEQQAARTPDAAALVFGFETLSYRELNERANALAHTLQRRGVGPERIVALLADRSPLLIIGILGILKAGGAYVAIDPSYPEERIRWMLEDCGEQLLLTERKYAGKVVTAVQEWYLDDADLYHVDRSNPELINGPSHLAYVLYTSGSTGRPKGALIEHRGLASFVKGFSERIPFFEGQSILAMATVSFDIFIVESLLPLSKGMRIVFANEEERNDAYLLQGLMERHKVDVLQITPSRFKWWIAQIGQLDVWQSLSVLMIGAEPLTGQLLERLRAQTNARIFNLYGPTETTVWTSIFEVTSGENISIGTPIDGAVMIVLNDELQLQPVGIVGEICIGGAGVGRGYLGHPEWNKGVFVPNPFQEGERLYRTGDLGRRLVTGEFQYVGRRDHQVKIRGHRIEIGEVEQQLLRHEHIKEAVVVAIKETDGEYALCAYVVVDSDIALLASELRRYLAASLPEYMIPAYTMTIDEIPLTPTGKVDRKALPKPQPAERDQREHIAPRNETERLIASLWEELLQVDNLGVSDNFFELGGHSLKAAALVSKLQEKFGVHVPLRQLFLYPTVESIANLISSEQVEKHQPIVRQAAAPFYPMSRAQRRQYMLGMIAGNTTMYHVPFALQIRGKLDIKQLEKAFKSLIARHESLRTTFHFAEGEFRQIVHGDVAFVLEKITVDDGSSFDPKRFMKPFDLEKAPLLRAGIYSIDHECHLLMLDMHHIVTDGMSTQVLVNELSQLYSGNVLTELRVQYRDYAIWQDGQLSGESYEANEKHWMTTFAGELPVLDLPTDYTRPATQSYEGKRIAFTLGAELTDNANSFAREKGVTLYTVLLAAYYVLLAKYSGQEDIVVGTPVAGRSHADVEGLIGMFVNTVAIRSKPLAEQEVGKYIAKVHDEVLKALEHQEYPFEDLVEKLDVPQDQSRNPLFDTMFILQNMEQSVLKAGELIFEPQPFEPGVSKFDLTLEAVEHAGQLELSLEYATALFEEETVLKMAQHYCTVVRELTTSGHAEKTIGQLDMLDDHERLELLASFSSDSYSEDRTNWTSLLAEIEEQVVKRPDAIAITFGEKKVTYSELNERANRLAHTLIHRGVGSECIVALMADRSTDLFVGILGIMKAGGAYVAIDPSYPVERINWMLEDCGEQLLLTERKYAGRVPTAIKEWYLDDPDMYEGLSTNPNQPLKQEQLAYVLYTSGSTGRPKGAMIEHRGLASFVKGFRERIPFTEGKGILAMATVSFDIFIVESLLPLSTGMRIVLADEEERNDAFSLQDLIVRHEVDVLQITPSRFKWWMAQVGRTDALKALGVLMIGAEPLTAQLLDRLRDATNARIFNLYGPTETTVWTSICEVTNGEHITIGTPIAGAGMVVLGNNLQLQPGGVVGELCIGGAGVGRGYLGHPEWNEGAFVPNPFRQGERMYRTGDLGLRLASGEFRYVGRRDHQVKIRGHRIEIGEIEQQLLRHESVKETVVVSLKEDDGEYALCAYIVTDSEPTTLPSELRNYLSASMPAYMIPAYVLLIDAIPLTPTGKVDRKSLPKPEQAERDVRSYIAPTTDTERKLAPLWEDLLKRVDIGAEDNFFELGGHSLKAALLVSRVQEHFGLQVALRDIFQNPTLSSLAGIIDGDKVQIYQPIPRQADREHYPMSRAQRRQYVMGLITEQTTIYNVPFALEMRGELDVVLLERAFNSLIARHESLRTTFHLIGDDFRQRIHAKVAFKLETIDCTSSSDEMPIDTLIGNVMQTFVRPFDLGNLHLLRATCIAIADKHHLLLLDMHHIVTDGVSVTVLVRELSQLYRGNELPMLAIQYRDYAAWQAEQLVSEVNVINERHWLETFDGELPVLSLPTDKPRPAILNYEGRKYSFMLDAELSNGVRKLAREQGTTLYTILLGAYVALLGKYTGQEDIVVGTPVAGRTHHDVEGLIGMFVNTVAIRSRPLSAMRVGKFIAGLHSDVVKAIEHQDYPFEDLIEKLDIQQDQSRNPLFDTMFILQNMERTTLEAHDLTFELKSFEQGVSKFDLTLEAVENGEHIEMSLEYATSLFEDATVARMAVHYAALMRSMTEAGSMERTLGKLELLNELEQGELLASFDQPSKHAHWENLLQEMERQAANNPTAIAIQFESETVTYGELNERANRLAHTLRDLGVREECIVALMADRSPDLFVGILGILKAGGAYVAIDPSYPEERIGWMLEDCGEQLLLTERKYAGRVRTALKEWYLDDSDMYDERFTNLDLFIEQEQLAYVLYTSGSTGRPKGAMIEHRGLANFVRGFRDRIPFAEGQSILAMATVSFDIFIVESLLPLSMGMRIVLAGDEERNDAFLLEGLINRHNVDVLQITPSRFKWWMAQVGRTDTLKSLRIVMIGAEPLTVQLLDRLRQTTDARIFNLYGPTETTVWTSIREVTFGNTITIGSPIAGAGMVVLDHNLEFVAQGVIGEICIGGAGVGRGYLGHPEWNEGAFVSNPFRNGERMYRTGDLGRRLNSGEFQYVGRRDHQVKIRGHRIEIGEVEQQLLRHEKVKETVVVALQEADGEYALCAYVVVRSVTLATELQLYLGGLLPAYMIPTYVMTVDSIPLTPTGKIDRKALPKPQPAERSEHLYVAPRSETERKLAKLWEELLHVSEVGATDHFFELGGHSLKAAALVSRIQEQFGVQLPLRELFQHARLEELSLVIDSSHKYVYEPIPKLEDHDHYPMSRSQRRQYVLGMISGDATMYHVPFAVSLQGKLDVDRLEKAFTSLIARHETLRTTFHYEGDEFRQRIRDPYPFKLDGNVWAKMTAKRLLSEKGLDETVTKLMARFIRPFDLATGPMIRAQLLPLEEERHLLLLDMHHIVTDGMSVSVLLHELTQLYSDNELPELRVQYRDYAAWLEEKMSGELYEKHQHYWGNIFSGELPVLDLPSLKDRPAIPSYDGRKYRFVLNKELSSSANKLARERGTTLYTVLLGAYAVLLGKYSGQEDIIIGTPVAGRGHVDAEGLIGMFINTVAIRIRPQAERLIGEYVTELQGNIVQALEHQDYPFEDLVDQLAITPNQGRNPLFDTMFILQNMERSALQAGDLIFDPLPFEQGVSKFDMTLEAVEHEGQIIVNWEYATDLFHDETIIDMARHYGEIIEEMTTGKGNEKNVGDIVLTNRNK
ncbi:amino acid adenylation domain-containing protein [Paenibacillus sp. GSMTC-2017]|uniref:non-ribosomal peptide synthetase n=1 Tax=Paenibacillus sp. GSMTC-2017 TaxID=2794350 RepID=UPI0018D88D2F|nr:non-ribosomal peptide synthetase [Paenibacillus sp. GSMTC-2017]MBH5318588.1 amino acid adenylation domain-containing protein [Paenibacillus sp. GSMTC-2017]